MNSQELKWVREAQEAEVTRLRAVIARAIAELTHATDPGTAIEYVENLIKLPF